MSDETKMQINIDTTRTTHVVYTHSVILDGATAPALLYVGCCRLSDLMTAPDARRNLTWRNTVRAAGSIVTIGILSMHDDEETAMRTAQDAARLYKAPANETHGIAVEYGYRGRVRCVTTGEEFPSAAAACKQFGVTSSQMSNHLARKSGFNTVAGMLFERMPS